MKCQTACFSGPRPEKLLEPWDENNRMIQSMKEQLQSRIVRASLDGYCNFMTGHHRSRNCTAAQRNYSSPDAHCCHSLPGTADAAICRLADALWPHFVNLQHDNRTQRTVLQRVPPKPQPLYGRPLRPVDCCHYRRTRGKPFHLSICTAKEAGNRHCRRTTPEVKINAALQHIAFFILHHLMDRNNNSFHIFIKKKRAILPVWNKIK